jgi:hypothetical protein
LSATVNFLTVTNSIAALAFTGASGTITVKDTDEIPESIGLDDRILAPNPSGFISNVELTRDELTGQNLRLTYVLSYRYYHCKIGGGMGGLFGVYAAMITNAAAILLAFSSDATLTGALDNDMPQITDIGPVNDPAGNGYHGFDITLRIMQFLEV